MGRAKNARTRRALAARATHDPDEQEKDQRLLDKGYAKTYRFRAHGWSYDGYRYAFVGQDREQIVRLSKQDWLSLDDAYATLMYGLEE